MKSQELGVHMMLKERRVVVYKKTKELERKTVQEQEVVCTKKRVGGHRRAKVGVEWLEQELQEHRSGQGLGLHTK